MINAVLGCSTSDKPPAGLHNVWPDEESNKDEDGTEVATATAANEQSHVSTSSETNVDSNVTVTIDISSVAAKKKTDHIDKKKSQKKNCDGLDVDDASSNSQSLVTKTVTDTSTPPRPT
jgi:hypothetical protein